MRTHVTYMRVHFPHRHNAISVVEGLQQCHYLEELHLENQMLPPGEKLVFDPRTIRVLSQTLMVLNVAGNRLEDLRDLSGLRKLGALYGCLILIDTAQDYTYIPSRWHCNVSTGI